MAPLEGCKNLVSLILDGNQLASLEGVGLKAMARLATLSARNNKITEIPDEVGRCELPRWATRWV